MWIEHDLAAPDLRTTPSGESEGLVLAAAQVATLEVDSSITDSSDLDIVAPGLASFEHPETVRRGADFGLYVVYMAA